MGPYAT